MRKQHSVSNEAEYMDSSRLSSSTPLSNQGQQTRRCYYFATEVETQRFASKLASYIKPPLIMLFHGEIGMGKTTLIRALLRALGIRGAVKSPTFSLIEHYEIDELASTLHHIDLYRIHDETELEYMGFRDLFTENAISCIEWPEKAGQWLEIADVSFFLTPCQSGRQMIIEAKSARGAELIGYLC